MELNYQFEGRYTENFIDGSSKCHRGVYYVTEKVTRFLVTFKPFGYEFPLFKDFCILKKKSKDMLSFYVNDLWN